MAEQSIKLEIAIHRRAPEEKWNVDEVKVGALVNELTEEPIHIARAGEEGSIKLEVQRTHEWELLLGLLVTGSGIFLTAVLTELGKRFAGWLADQIRQLNIKGKVELRAQGMARVVISQAELATAQAAITDFVKAAAQKGLPVEVVLEAKG